MTKGRKMSEIFPKNVVLLATHGSYFVPKSLEGNLSGVMTKNDFRLLKNFSDYGAAGLIPDETPEEQKVVAWFSRALGDPNRLPSDGDFFRDKDFGGNDIWQQPLSAATKRSLINEYYNKYYVAVETAINRAESYDRRVLVLDFHDTGDLLLGADPEKDTNKPELFPDMCLCDRRGATCDADLVAKFIEQTKEILNIDLVMNYPYIGSNVIKHFGEDCRDSQFNSVGKRNILQIEVPRRLYMDETPQVVDTVKIAELKKDVLALVKNVAKLL